MQPSLDTDQARETISIHKSQRAEYAMAKNVMKF